LVNSLPKIPYIHLVYIYIWLWPTLCIYTAMANFLSTWLPPVLSFTSSSLPLLLPFYLSTVSIS
jgi:hypothetical protein